MTAVVAIRPGVNLARRAPLPGLDASLEQIDEHLDNLKRCIHWLFAASFCSCRSVCWSVESDLFRHGLFWLQFAENGRRGFICRVQPGADIRLCILQLPLS